MIVYRPIHIYNFGLLVEVVVMMNWKKLSREYGDTAYNGNKS